ncbi:hypothetical protein BC940DRAFT_289441 [Gongronella butleri]|nr:hypothetical protein BC940DRAFT_289441 [Gongronella butleri]
MKYLDVCQALYDYEPRTPDEIAIQENDILYVIEKEDDEWWKVEVKQRNEEPGPVGLVPASYVEQVQPVGKVIAEYDYEARQEEELNLVEGQEMWVLERDDPDWFLVKLETGELGLVPSNYVQDMDDDGNAAPEAAVEEQQQPSPASMVPPPVAIAPPVVQTAIATPTTSSSSPLATVKPDVDDEAQSWTVHVYDAAKKKKKKSKGNLLVGNALLCFGSETDKASPVQQYAILDVAKYLMDGKVLHIEIDQGRVVLDLQASSKSEAKAIINKISESRQAAQRAGTHVNASSPAMMTPTTPISSMSAPSPAIAQPPMPAASPAANANANAARWAISLYDFEAQGGDEVAVQENEQVLVTDADRDDGWWHVETTDGRAGIVPSAYIQFTDEDAAPEQQQDHHHAHHVHPSLPPRPAPTTLAVAAANAAASDDDADVDTAAHDEVEEYLRNRDPERQEHLALERQIAENERKEMQRRQEEEDRHRRDDEERERRRKAQEAAQRQEIERQRQMEEERRKREREQARSAAAARDALPKPDPDRLRTWTDRSGSFRVDAQYLSFSDGKLRLHKSNGVKIDVPVDKMSSEDIRWVERRNNLPLGTLSGEKPKQQRQVASAERTPEMPPRPMAGASAAPLSAFSSPPPAAASLSSSSNAVAIVKKTPNPSWDWFDWFLKVGVPMQQALIYSSAFQGDRLDDTDLDRLTYKQFKSLGVKEKHIRRIERYLDTGKLEPPSDDEENDATNDAERQNQIRADEEYARKLQKEMLGDTSKRSGDSRPKPAKSAPKQVHPDLLDLLGSDFDATAGTSSASSKDLAGFSDDAWAPRPTAQEQASSSVPLQPQPVPQPAAPSPAPVTSPVQPVQPVQQAQPAQQLQQQAQSPQQTPPTQQQQQQAATYASANKTIDPSLHQWPGAALPGSSSPAAGQTRQNMSLNDIKMQEQMQRYQQQQRQQALIEQQQSMIMQQQHHIAQQQIQQQQLQIQQLQHTGQPNPQQHQIAYQVTGQQQPLMIQGPQMTGMMPQTTGFIQQPQLQQQMHPQFTGFMPQQQQQQQPAAFHSSAFQRPQPTGWQASTPDNPFGSGSSTTALYQTLQPQMTGVQQTELSGARDKYAPFRTPNADVFTPNGSMQLGQTGFSQQQGQGW